VCGRSLRQAFLLALLFAVASIPVHAALVGARERPNVLVIMTDDQRADALAPMPTVRKELKARGTYFPNAFAPNPLCCPSRAATLTGLHSHHTGVYGNKSPHGGFEAFDDRVTIATVLQGVGYRTAYVGKYLNEYNGADLSYVPDGWDRWFAFGNGAYFDYWASVNGDARRYGERDTDYSPRVMSRQARSFIRGVPDRKRFFLVFASAAAHGSQYLVEAGRNMPVPAHRDLGRFDGIEDWRPASYGDRDDLSDMPTYVRGSPWDRAVRRGVDLFRQRQLEALRSLDRQIAKLLDEIPRNTLVLYLSDNGFLWGEHRWSSKFVPYEESIRIPLIMRWPGRVRMRTDRRLALNIDVAPTILAAVGLDRSTPTGMDTATGSSIRADGRSLLDRRRRRAFPLEHFDSTPGGVPGYCGVRTRDGWMYARYWEEGGAADNGFEELYRVGRDRLQRRNLVGTPSFDDERLELRDLTRDLCDPVPPGYRWGG
jgi:arylsulfatase A-like enzyme